LRRGYAVSAAAARPARPPDDDHVRVHAPGLTELDPALLSQANGTFGAVREVGAAIVAGGALAAGVGGRATFALAGALALLVLIQAQRTLRRARPTTFPDLVPAT
jgi:hypothetical protein